VSHKIDVIQLWKTHEPELPCWSRAFKFVLLVQPSSAASEGVFSILTNSFQHKSSIEDYVQLSVMLHYNYRCFVSLLLNYNINVGILSGRLENNGWKIKNNTTFNKNNRQKF